MQISVATYKYPCSLANLPKNIQNTSFRASFRNEAKICQTTTCTIHDMERRKMQLYENNQLVKTRIYCGMYEKETDSAANVKQYCYIAGGNGVTAVLINEELYFLRRDVQGTITGLVNQNDSIVEEYSYDACLSRCSREGRRRNPTNWTYDSVPQPQYMHRGYTMHEMLDEFGLINMNGRCYDPVVGRFLSPDIIVQNPNNTQCYNRYSYAVNNPLKYTDPSGWSYGTLEQMRDNEGRRAWLNMCEFNRRMQYESNISSVKIIGQASLKFFRGEAEGTEHFSIQEIIKLLEFVRLPGFFGNPGKHDPPDEDVEEDCVEENINSIPHLTVNLTAETIYFKPETDYDNYSEWTSYPLKPNCSTDIKVDALNINGTVVKVRTGYDYLIVKESIEESDKTINIESSYAKIYIVANLIINGNTNMVYPVDEAFLHSQEYNNDGTRKYFGSYLDTRWYNIFYPLNQYPDPRK